MNEFEKLCKLASKENWCWKLFCTTCGHLHFRYAFSELAKEKVCDDEDWIIHSSNTNYIIQFGEVPRSYSEQEKKNILRICENASIFRIMNGCKFPDWLGYIGLILDHMYISTDEYRAVSYNWASQLQELVSPNSDAYARLNDILAHENDFLNIHDLEMCEIGLDIKKVDVALL